MTHACGKPSPASAACVKVSSNRCKAKGTLESVPFDD
jgi:hypothetical protein